MSAIIRKRVSPPLRRIPLVRMDPVIIKITVMLTAHISCVAMAAVSLVIRYIPITHGLIARISTPQKIPIRNPINVKEMPCSAAFLVSPSPRVLPVMISADCPSPAENTDAICWVTLVMEFADMQAVPICPQTAMTMLFPPPKSVSLIMTGREIRSYSDTSPLQDWNRLRSRKRIF